MFANPACDHGGEYRLAGPLFRPPTAGGRPTSPRQVSAFSCIYAWSPLMSVTGYNMQLQSRLRHSV